MSAELQVPEAERPFWNKVALLGYGWSVRERVVHITVGGTRMPIDRETMVLMAEGLGLQELPAEIGALVNLRSLWLDNNRLTTLPTEIGALGRLVCLDLSDNRLTALPAEIGALVNLQCLFLSNNQLTALPAEIVALVRLRELELKNNQLTALPAEIGMLVNVDGVYVFNGWWLVSAFIRVKAWVWD